jgi:enterochelin esterase family protein
MFGFFARHFPLICLCLVAGNCAAQEGAPQRPPEFSSIEVKDDRTITAKIWAPQAKQVRFSGSDLPGATPFGGGTEMTQGDNGVWEATLGPVSAGTYRYNFNVDGVSVIDPRNPATSESNANTWSVLVVPGSEVSDLKDVPHGAVAHWQYYSKSLNRFRRAHVYTPPGYELGGEPLPVLYLLHGAMDSDASWSSVGRAGIVLDNLIAAGKAKPMIVVMPMGHTGPFAMGPGGNRLQNQMSEFHQDFVNDLRPQVEQRYRVSNKREHRAIAGLSMGGAQTLEVAVKNLGDYGYIGVFSSGVFGITGAGPGGNNSGPKWEETHAAVLDDAELKKGLRLVWFATGKEDFLLATTQETVRVLKAHGFDVQYEETDGGHTWIKWREHYLPAFAQMLFHESP